MTLDEYQVLKAKVEGLRRNRDQAAGAAAQVTRQLQEEFGCADLTAAEEMLRKLEVEGARLEKRLAKELAAFEDRWREAVDNE